MWSVILLMSRLPGGHSMSVSRRPESNARLPTVESLLEGTIGRLVLHLWQHTKHLIPFKPV